MASERLRNAVSEALIDNHPTTLLALRATSNTRPCRLDVDRRPTVNIDIRGIDGSHCCRVACVPYTGKRHKIARGGPVFRGGPVHAFVVHRTTHAVLWESYLR
jgi:hypothetical protein